MIAALPMSTARATPDAAIVAIVVGVVFGLDQLRQLRIQRDVHGGAELLRSLQSPDMARAALLIFELPDDLSRDELRARLGDDWGAVIGLLAVFESLGPLVARGHLPVAIYEDFYRGATVVCWRKLHRYITGPAWMNLWFGTKAAAQQTAAI